MTAFWSALGIVAGMLIALQGPINAQLARGLGMPVAAAAASFLAGTVVLVVITLVLDAGAGRRDQLACAAVVDVRRRGMPRRRVRHLRAHADAEARRCGDDGVHRLRAVVGRACSSTASGYFDLAVRELTLGRVAGACLLVVGALLISVN